MPAVSASSKMKDFEQALDKRDILERLGGIKTEQEQPIRASQSYL
jgi:hypothetical protein